jgi:hypothetical protein
MLHNKNLEAIQPGNIWLFCYIDSTKIMFFILSVTKLLSGFVAGKPVFTQLFMGFAGMGSDVHSAMGCNIFRQITGRKKVCC